MKPEIPTPDLLSLVLTLRPLANSCGSAPDWWGRASHALLLRAIASVDPALAAALHADDGPRPFTASSLFERGAQTDCVRFTAHQSAPAGCLRAASGPGGVLAPGARVDLDGHAFEVLSATSDPAAHPWAGQGGYADLAARRLVSPDPAPRQVTLQLASPTAFKSQERHQPLPLPDLVFNSLLERWNASAPLAFPPETRRYAAECLAISRFELRSRPVPGKNGGLRIGAVGLVTYTTLNYDRYWMSLIHTLAAFSLYAGLGAGTSQGLGQCRVMEEG